MASAHLLRTAPTNNNGHHHRRSSKNLGYCKILPRIPVSLVEEIPNGSIHPPHSLFFHRNVGPTAETGQQQHQQQQQQHQHQPSLGNYRYKNKTYHYQQDVTKDTNPSWKSSISTPPFHFPKSDGANNKVTCTNYCRTNHHHQLLVHTQNLPAISPLGRKQAATLSSKKFFDEPEVLSIDDTTTVHDGNDECTVVVVIAHHDDTDHWSLDTFPCNSTGSLSQTEKEYKHRRVTDSPYGIIVTAKKVAWKYDDYNYTYHSKDDEDNFDDMSSVLHIEQHMNFSDFSHLLDGNCAHHPAATEEEKRTEPDHSCVQHNTNHHHHHHHEQKQKQESNRYDVATAAEDDDDDDDGDDDGENDTINSTEFVLRIIDKKNNHEDDISCISEMSSTMRF